MNGAELANGSILHVEPSDSNYITRVTNPSIQLKSRNDHCDERSEANDEQLGKSSDRIVPSAVNQKLLGDSVDNDLDDFFDSL
jgi:hypothetical protein